MSGLLIGITFCDRPVQPEWAISLAHLVSSLPINTRFGLSVTKGAPIGQARNAIAEQALRDNAKYLFFIDDDTAPPNFAVSRLMSLLDSQPDVAAAGGIYVTKSNPAVPVVGRRDGDGPSWDWKVGDVFDCEVIGTGCLLIRVDVFNHIERPWFKEESEIAALSPENEVLCRKTTDDIYFLRKAREAGYRILADASILPVHWDANKGIPYLLPADSYPLQKDGDGLEKALGIMGWMDKSELVWLAAEAQKHSKIAEVGSFMGRSSRVLGDNTPGSVDCFDDFKGPRDVDIKREDIHKQFLANVGDLVKCGKIKVFVEDHEKVKPKQKYDMVFIDGDHQYENVKRDIQLWRNALAPGGMICGHDADMQSVRRAVQEEIPNALFIPGSRLWFYESKQSNALSINEWKKRLDHLELARAQEA